MNGRERERKRERERERERERWLTNWIPTTIMIIIQTGSLRPEVLWLLYEQVCV